MNRKKVSVFCGALPGKNKTCCDEMKTLGRLLAADGWRIVYSGIRSGMMRSLVDGAREENGRVKAFVPQSATYKNSVMESGITLIRVHDKYDRMRNMAHSQAFIIGPGSFGTLSDAMNILERNYRAYCLGQPLKPMFFINTDGIFNPLAHIADDFVARGFSREGAEKLVRFAANAEEAAAELRAAEEDGQIASTQGHVVRASGQLEHL